jgi:Zn-finger nucleic acid-binding protein
MEQQIDQQKEAGEKCQLCGKELAFWSTSLKKHEGKKVCSSCAMKLAKGEIGHIKETKCTCLGCGNVWFYGKKDVFEARTNKMRNASKEMMCCSGCLPAVFIPDKKTIDLNKCPKCGSHAVKKEEVVHVI